MTTEEFAEIKHYFANKELPQTLQYNECTFMGNLPAQIKSDISILERFGYVNTFAASWERLVNIRKILESEHSDVDGVKKEEI